MNKVMEPEGSCECELEGITWIHLFEKQLHFLGNLVSAATSRGY